MQNHPDENGMYSCLMVDERMHSFANFLCWAAYRLYLVHRNESFMREALPGLKKQISSWKEVYGNDRDGLMTEYWHTRTGKEYQPSYWYFHDYPRNPKDRETYTHVKRVDRTVYHYLNVLGVARLCEALDDPEADTYKQMAERIKKDVLELMWDNETDFFYDLHYQTDEKAFVKNIVGFYPAWAEILDERHDGLIPHLLNPAEFATRCPFPTVSADSTAYSREGGWFGQFVKGRNGCMWNGPTWPYTNSIVLDALARESRRHQHAYDEAFGRALREYSFLHFRDRDLNQPGLVEHYNSATGEPLSDEQEYNHSYYLDLVISHVAGLSVESDKLVFDPLDIGLDYFELEGVKAAGHILRIVYGRPGHHRFPEGVEAGYRVYLDGELAYSSDRLARTELSIPKS
ncbi:trehalase family glycosidase [Paenibacillus sp. CC-CFT747]|nr:trehalase family glycosidase [Paenibacillus sp. CC-CFT747]